MLAVLPALCVCVGGLASMSWIPSSSLRPCLKRSPLCVPEATRLLGSLAESRGETVRTCDGSLCSWVKTKPNEADFCLRWFSAAKPDTKGIFAASVFWLHGPTCQQSPVHSPACFRRAERSDSVTALRGSVLCICSDVLAGRPRSLALIIADFASHRSKTKCLV